MHLTHTSARKWEKISNGKNVKEWGKKYIYIYVRTPYMPLTHILDSKWEKLLKENTLWEKQTNM